MSSNIPPGVPAGSSLHSPNGRTDQAQWINCCAQRLHQRWHTVGQAQLEELAEMIWQDAGLRCMEPADAAALWLAPVSVAPVAPSAV